MFKEHDTVCLIDNSRYPFVPLFSVGQVCSVKRNRYTVSFWIDGTYTPISLKKSELQIVKY